MSIVKMNEELRDEDSILSGSQTAFCNKYKISNSRISEIVNGKWNHPIPPRILKALGFERIVLFRKIK